MPRAADVPTGSALSGRFLLIAFREQSAMAITAAKKAPNPTDRHVGARVRMRRKMLAMSQTQLADALARIGSEIASMRSNSRTPLCIRSISSDVMIMPSKTRG